MKTSALRWLTLGSLLLACGEANTWWAQLLWSGFWLITFFYSASELERRKHDKR